jgi:VIT1/CCC1 family predicted Fe2+/Mn2+ transporter
MLVVELEHEHTPDAIADRIASSNHNYIRDFIYGGIDGAVTTFAVVSGVSGAELSTSIVLILGFANLVADGFSMAASNYLGTRAEIDDYRRLEKVEHRHIRIEPEGEREEIRQIYREKGFEGEELEKAVELITSDKDRWVKTMLTEEYGLPAEIRSPWRAALATFAAFIVCGLVPLVPYLFGVKSSLNDGRDILSHWIGKEPLVDGELVSISHRDPVRRCPRSRARLRCRCFVKGYCRIGA